MNVAYIDPASTGMPYTVLLPIILIAVMALGLFVIVRSAVLSAMKKRDREAGNAPAGSSGGGGDGGV